MTDKASEQELPFELSSSDSERSGRLRAKLASALAEAECTDVLSIVLRRLQDADGITPEQMAARLKTDITGLNRLALCRSPRDAHFVEDVATLAGYCTCDTSALLSLLRQAQVLAVFAEPVPNPVAAPLTAGPTATGWLGDQVLIAARDSEETGTDGGEDADHE